MTYELDAILNGQKPDVLEFPGKSITNNFELTSDWPDKSSSIISQKQNIVGL